jgi:hypothetical protein
MVGGICSRSAIASGRDELGQAELLDLHRRRSFEAPHLQETLMAHRSAPLNVFSRQLLVDRVIVLGKPVAMVATELGISRSTISGSADVELLGRPDSTTACRDRFVRHGPGPRSRSKPSSARGPATAA